MVSSPRRGSSDTPDSGRDPLQATLARRHSGSVSCKITLFLCGDIYIYNYIYIHVIIPRFVQFLVKKGFEFTVGQFTFLCTGHCRGCCQVEGADGQSHAAWLNLKEALFSS